MSGHHHPSRQTGLVSLRSMRRGKERILPKLEGLEARVLLSVVAARTADGFVESIGVNTHLSESGNPYQIYNQANYGTIKNLLVNLGVRHIRDSVSSDLAIPTAAWTTELRDLAASGIRSLLITDNSRLSPTATASAIANTVNAGGVNAVEAVSGFNENDGQHKWYAGLTDVPAAVQWQQDLYAAIKANPGTSGLTVTGPSFTTAGAYASAGNLSAYLDNSEVHHYLAARNPGTPGWGDGGYGSIPYAVNNLAHVQSPTKSSWFTEMGYSNATTYGGAWPGTYPPTWVSGRYLPRQYLMNFGYGGGGVITRSYAYELLNEGDNLGNPELNFGLVDSNFNPKPAYYALQNLISTLSDPGSSFTPGTLDFWLSGDTSDVTTSLLQKQNGDYYLAIWQETHCWDPNGSWAIGVNPRSVNVNLNDPMTSGATLYTLDDNGTMTTSNATLSGVAGAQRLTLNVSDRVTLIKLTKAATQGSSYSASRDFSSTQGYRNWYYGYYNSGTTTFVQDASYNSSTSSWQGPEQYNLLGANGGHPGSTYRAVRRWVAPAAGNYTVSGGIALGATGGNGIVGLVYQNGVQKWSQSVGGSDPAAYTYSLNLTLSAGESVDFVIDCNGSDNGNDSTNFTAYIAPTTVSYSSVSDFSSTQGYRNWYYGYYSSGTTFVQDGSYVSGNSWWQGPEQYNLLWANGGHPGHTSRAVRRWVAPSAGTYTVSGSFALNATGGNGVTGLVYQSGVQKWSKTVGGNDTTAYPYSLNLTLSAGESVDFVIDCNGSDNGYDSTSFTATLATASGAPTAPSALSATATSSSQINLAWTDSSSNETGFKIERATDSGFTQNLTLVTTTAANVTNYSNIGLTAGTTYYYRLRATNASGDSANSNAANATTSAALNYNSVSDFSSTQGYRNWYYGFYNSGTTTFVQDSTYSSGSWQGPETYCLVGADGGHPGATYKSVRRWVAPSAGTYTVSGSFALNATGGNGIVGLVYQNGVQKWSKTVGGNDTTAYPYSLILTLSAGESVDFVIDCIGSDNGHDSTAFTASIAPTTVSYSSVSDFSSTQGYRNWYYGYYNSGTTTFVQDNTYNNGSWQGPETYCLVGANGGHPGGTYQSVRRWIAPSAGTYQVSGVIHLVETGGNGIIGYIRQNGTQAWSQSISGSDTSAHNFSLNLTVAAGDAIDFVIDANGWNYYFDSTEFTATITPTA